MHFANLVVITALLLCFFASVEIFARHIRPVNELTRKLVHILSGVFAAFFPLWINYVEIILISLAFAALMYVSKRFGILSSIHDTKRRTNGEIFFPLGVALTAFFVPHQLAYTYGILILALGDGLAGLLGSRYGKKQFSLFGATKSYVGSSVFFLVALVVGLLMGIPWPVVLTGCVVLTSLELLLSRGLDNIVLPLAAALLAYNLSLAI